MLYAVTLELTAPILNYSVSSGNLTLSWDPAVSGYVLYSASQLSPANWAPVAGVVNNSVTIAVSPGAAQYFSLVSPPAP